MNLTRDIFGARSKFAILIDPDHEDHDHFDVLLDQLEKGAGDIILIGGSSSNERNITSVIRKVRGKSNLPILLFPGNLFQLSSEADALLLPSLISGRNPDYLIGKHVEAASMIHRSGIPVFSMGYIIVAGGKVSAASYMTQTMPIPEDQIPLVVQTALAGQLLGMKSIYIESGSGANHPAGAKMIQAVKSQVNLPLIVGGGMTTIENIISAQEAGADMVVLGTIFEEKPELLTSFYDAFIAHSTV